MILPPKMGSFSLSRGRFNRHKQLLESNLLSGSWLAWFAVFLAKRFRLTSGVGMFLRSSHTLTGKAAQGDRAFAKANGSHATAPGTLGSFFLALAPLFV